MLTTVQMLGLSGCIHYRAEFSVDFLIGERADGREWFEYGYLGRAKKVQQLPGGNLEYVFDHTGECKYALEVDKSTRRFVGWRFFGNPDACWMGT